MAKIGELFLLAGDLASKNVEKVEVPWDLDLEAVAREGGVFRRLSAGLKVATDRADGSFTVAHGAADARRTFYGDVDIRIPMEAFSASGFSGDRVVALVGPVEFHLTMGGRIQDSILRDPWGEGEIFLLSGNLERELTVFQINPPEREKSFDSGDWRRPKPAWDAPSTVWERSQTVMRRLYMTEIFLSSLEH